ncbi:MAG TPA: HlyD family efflux transporter periplasmic adaptor subunit [Thermoanaerobaculia bacterium]|nr:HlyD family efflux transporter periplasmic adaptor subunit [Thermoanaerobaculia bacterium]
MDIVRNPKEKNAKRRAVYVALAVAAVVLTTVAFARLKPAAPPADRNTLVIETVARGPLTRAVRGSGVLVPENVRWIAAATEGRVERVVVQPGTRVSAESVIIELSDPQQQQSARDAEWQLRAAEAAYAAAKAELESDRLDREAAAARLRAETQQARLRAKADAELATAGLAASITKQLSESTAASLEQRLVFEEQRLSILASSQRSRLAALQAEVEQRKAMLDLQQQRIASLQVRAGIDGVLQQVAVQAGQRVNAGTTLARVAQPDRLKAEIRIPETQAKDIILGQHAQIDTRTGVVDGRVARIDPAASNGTVLVDVAIDGALPAGARPDLSVDATIELERLTNVVYVARPVRAQENASGTVLRVDGNHARRVKVEYGRASATSIEIRRGLAPGDQVIVSDDSAWDNYDEIKIQ